MPFQMLSTGKKTDAHIRKTLHQWWEESGQTMAKAGEAIEWSQQTVSAYFNGGQQIDIVRCFAWCEHFGYTVADLLKEAPKPKAENPRLKLLREAFLRQDEKMQDGILALIGALPSEAQAGRAAPRRAGRRG